MATYTATINKFDALSEEIGDVNLNTANLKVALINYNTGSNAPTGSEAAFSTYASGKEASAANGYTAGGAALSGVTWSQTSGTATFDCTDPQWTASGGNLGNSTDLGYWVVYNSDTDVPLFWGLLDSTPAAITVSDGNILTLQINASGLFTLT